MISDTLRILLKRYQFHLNMIWGGLTLNILLFPGIAYYILASGGGEGLGPSHATLEFVFRLVAVSLGIGSVLWWRLHLSDDRLKASLAREVSARSLASNRETGQIDEDLLSKIESLSEFEQRLLSLASGYPLPYVISPVLNVTIVLAGVVLAFLTANTSKMVPFVLAAIILNVLMFPRLITLVNRASQLVPPEMPEGTITQLDNGINKTEAVGTKDKLRMDAILVIVGAVVFVVGRHLIGGNKGLIVAVVGFCILMCGQVMWMRKLYKK
jgi:hypothetical protein